MATLIKDAATATPQQAEITVQEAADLLCVSQPYLIKLLDGGEISCRMAGTYRRVLRADVVEYKTRIDEARLATLQELTSQAQELGMGY
jgi:excisionase family DNA binding protein